MYPPDSSSERIFYLALNQGQIIFSGDQKLTWKTLLKVLQRYLPLLQSRQAQQKIALIIQELQQEDEMVAALHLRLIDKLQNIGLINQNELEKALYLKVLSDFEMHLLISSGEAQFLPSLHLDLQSPVVGFTIEDLMTQLKERRAWWHSLSAYIPSMERIPVLNAEAIAASALTLEQKQGLQTLVANGQTLNEIAVTLSQDRLDLAKVFAQLIRDRLISLSSPAYSSTSEIFVVDDSVLLLRQFETLVSGWGYVVRPFQDPQIALQNLLQSKPAVVFLDINMPGLSGFDLVKQIRRQPPLESLPLVMLTAEKTLANNWQARLSGCRFLSKPLAPHEMSRFATDLRALLTELIPST